MAEGLKKLIECPVCIETYQDPKALPCDHALCSKCVDRVRMGFEIKCPLCKTIHHVSKVRPDFRLAQILDALKDKDDRSSVQSTEDTTKCELCCKHSTSFRCEDCQQWICKVCKSHHLRSTSSRTHNLTPVATKCQEVSEQLKKESTNLTAKIDAQSKSIQKLELEIRKLEKSQAHVLQSSAQLRQKRVKEIHDYFDSIDSQITDIFYSHIYDFELMKKRYIKALRDFNINLKRVDEVMKESTVPLAVDGNQILNGIKANANVQSDEEITAEEVNLKVLQDNSWVISNAAKLELNGEDVELSYSRFHHLDLTNLKDHKFTKKNQVELEQLPCSVRKIGGSFWVCGEKGFIQTFNKELQNLRDLTNQTWGDLCDITEIDNGELVLAGYKGLIHINAAGAEINRIESGKYNSVAFYENMLYAYAFDPARICVYSFGDTWKKINNIKMSFTEDAYVTVTVKDDKIIACSARDNKIITTSLTGRIVDKLDTSGSGSNVTMKWPYLCQADEFGSLLIADRYTDCLQVVEKRGYRNVIVLEPAVTRPCGCVVSDNRIYVISHGGGSFLLLYEHK